MRDAPLHPDFYDLQGKVHYIVERIRGKEWSSSCPFCGGEPHQSGEWPDRFRMWRVSKIGKPFGWCRSCGGKWLQEKEIKADPEKLEHWRQERIEEETRRQQETEQALKLLQDAKRWEFYTDTLEFCDEGRDYWKRAGIGLDVWWYQWALGWDREHEFWCDVGGKWAKHVTATATIAERNMNGDIINIKHRLIKPQPDGTKYRMEYKTGIEPVFFADLLLGNCAEQALLLEGEKKAAVTWLTLDDHDYQAFGLPKTPSQSLLQSISAKTIYYLPDPDVKREEILRVKHQLPDRELYLVRLIEKIDDLILAARLDHNWMVSVLEHARRM